MKIFSICQLDSWQIRQKAWGFSLQVWNPFCSLIRNNYGVIILTCKSEHNCKYRGVRSGCVFCSEQFFHVLKESHVDCARWFWLVLGGVDFSSSFFCLHTGSALLFGKLLHVLSAGPLCISMTSVFLNLLSKLPLKDCFVEHALWKMSVLLTPKMCNLAISGACCLNFGKCCWSLSAQLHRETEQAFN